MTTLLRASNSETFLSLIPVLAGFTPKQSVMLMPFNDKHTSGALRADLPEEGADITGFTRRVWEVFARVPRITGMAIVVFCNEAAIETRPETSGGTMPNQPGIQLPYTDLVNKIMALAAEHRLPIIDALCVTPHGWGSYLRASTKLLTLPPSPAIEQLPELPQPAASQSIGAELPQVTEVERTEVSAEISARNSLPRPTTNSGQAFLELLEAALERPENPTPEHTAQMLLSLSVPSLRDLAIAHWALGFGAVEPPSTEIIAGRSTPALSTRVTTLLLGMGARPDPDRLRLALSVSRRAAAVATGPIQAAPLCIAGWMSWALGNSTHAGIYLEQARTADPGCTLASLLLQILDASILPDWIFDPDRRRPPKRSRRAALPPTRSTGSHREAS